ncbi:sensor histidine kinase [Micromonospora sp. NBC_01796]|uniref:sensor histidine kinase n=1 Tax=Micromonospora sp. NBC_01796 TaxID=2975987 RepID=UPI002DD7A74A|nr:sensor histidine kinase [Micromonospora sp. NBC_01796]WSA87290.1 sensor histidine kinase [Micromonospora sp. NBC_01796]
MTTQEAQHWERPGPTPAQRRHDWQIGALLVGGGLLSVLLLNSSGTFALGHPPSWPEQLAWIVGITAPMAWRRRWPEVTTLLTAAVFIGAQARAHVDTLVSSVTLFVAIYTLGAWGRDRRRADVIRIAVIVAMFCWLALSAVLAMPDIPADAFSGAAGPLPPLFAVLLTSVLFNLTYFVFAYLFGNTAWLSARRQHEVQVQTEALRRSQAVLAERAVIQERVRIARELHDVVAHHVAVMGVQAAAARRVMDQNPPKAKTALAAVEQTARTAIDELRRLLGVLRQADASTDPLTEQPTGHRLDQVETLLSGAREAGLTVDFRTFGEPVPLTDSVSLAVYRIMQEALTNTIKHARANLIDVRIRYLRQEIEVDVADDGRTPPEHAVRPPSGSGLGLIGMRERVAAHGGVLEVGARDGGGFRVRARLPLHDDVRSAETVDAG